MKTHTKKLLAALVCSVTIGSATADVIASDDFSTLDPAWVIDVNSDGVGGNLVFETNGTDVRVHEELGAAGGDNEGTMTRAFDATGFTDVTLTLDVSQRVPASFEGTEYLDISVDTGSGFQSIFNQSGLLSTGAAGLASAADAISTGPLALGPGADNNSAILVKLTINTGFWDEDGGGTNGQEEYILENLVLEGVVPEPGSLALLGLGGLLIGARRRRA